MKWDHVELGRLVTIKSGKRMPKGTAFDRGETPHPYIRARDIGGGRIEIVDPVFVPDTVFPKIARYIVEAGNVCVTIVGANVGAIGQVPPSLHGASLTENAVRFTELKELDENYLKHALLLDVSQWQMQYVAGGAAQPKLGIYKIKRITIPHPPLSTQQNIARTLAAYDDLIENNRRRMALLEEAARQLYKEWFVRLRFPGHEKTKIVDGVPEGWSVLSLADICEEVTDRVHPHNVPPDTPYLGLEHLPRKSIALREFGRAMDVGSSKFRFAEGDVLFGKIRPYFHKVLPAPFSGICSSDTIVIRAREPHLWPIVVATTTTESFVAFASQTARVGARMPRADWKKMKEYSVLLPAVAELRRFGKHLGSTVKLVQTLCRHNQRLAEARDLLLPRLMSGEIEV